MPLSNRWLTPVLGGSAFVFTCGLQLWLARDAAACSCVPCRGGFFVPQSGSVPANASGLWWLPASDNVPADPESARLVQQRAEGDLEVDITVEPQTGGGVLIRPTQELVAGARYFLRGTNACTSSTSASEVEFTVTPSAPLPTELGTLTASAPTLGILGIESGGPCSDSLLAVSTKITLEVTEQAAPWRDLFFYETLVDGVPWKPRNNVCQEIAPGASWYGRATDVVYLLCHPTSPDTLNDSVGVTAGTHTITMRAKLVGTDVVVASSAQTIEFSCENDSTGSDGSSSESSSTSLDTNSSTSDGQNSTHDTSSSSTTGTDTSTGHPSDDESKGCTLVDRGGRSRWLLFGLGLVISGMKGRRRRLRPM